MDPASLVAPATGGEVPSGCAQDHPRIVDQPDERTGIWSADLFARQLGALGEGVRAIRQSHGWSQQDLHGRTGIGRAKVWKIEHGKQNLTLELLWRLADAFRTHWADLLDDRIADPRRGQHRSVPFDQQLAAFATRLYQARVLQHLTQQQLTDRTQIGRSAVAEIEDGAQNVTLKTLSRLAAGLGVHWADLLDDRRTTPPQPDRSRTESPVPGAADHDERQREPLPRDANEELAAAFAHYDRPRLVLLSPVQRHRHLYARRLLSDYLDEMWHDAQHDGVDPIQQPEWASVAALRHLAHHLWLPPGTSGCVATTEAC